MTFEIKTTLPPEIQQSFNSELLRTPCEFGDNLKRLMEIYIYIQMKLLKKAKYNPRWMEKCLKLQEEFIELYGRIQEKKKDTEGKAKNKTQEPFYYINGLDKGCQKIFDRLRNKSYSISFEQLKNYKV